MKTQPINTLARRIANALGLRDTHELFPHVLIDGTETPAQWFHRHRRALTP